MTTDKLPDTAPEETPPAETVVAEATLPEAVIAEAVVDEAAAETSVRGAANWARLTDSLTVGEVPPEARNINVTGRRQTGPMQGFGKMWQKTYRVSMTGAEVTPQEVVADWKAKFPSFWPDGNRFYGPLTGIAPGDVALLNLTMPGRLMLSTGVLVMYADEESFTFMTPEGHMFAAFITFSAFEGTDGVTTAQAQVLLRANDPLFEIGLACGGHRKEDTFWVYTLTALAAHFGVETEVETQVVCVDKRRQWRRAKNIRYNSAIRSGVYMIGTPFRSLRRPRTDR
ncbi:MAG: hypothetical protein M3343_10100 [Actinomycetota bacterium]|nr:hypothetical protein [Actinomycetota bacterium]